MRKTLWIASVLLISACGGGGGTTTGPSPNVGPLEGVWNGTLDVDGVPSQTRWTFHTLPTMVSYQTTATIPALTLTGSMVSTVVNDTAFHTGSTYHSPAGCDGVMTVDGTASATRITGRFFAGAPCDPTREGQLSLSR